MGSILQCSIPVIEGDMTRIFIVAIKDKNMGFELIGSIPLNHGILLKALLTTKKYTSVMIRVCHSRSRFLSCMYIHDKFMTESR